MTGEVQLAPMDADRVESTHDWLMDDELRRSIDSLGRPTREEHNRYWQDRLADPNREAFAITLDAQHIGNCGLIVDAARRKAELWIYLGRERGRGAGRAATGQLLTRAFDDLGLHRVFVRVLETNAAALRFWRSLGFREEGRLRADTWIADTPVDAFVLAMLVDQWRALTLT